MARRPVGHEAVITALEAHLPPATLLVGPEGVGKRTAANWLADHHGVHPTERIDLGTLKVGQVRDFLRRASLRPNGPHLLGTGTTDGASTEGLNAMLKALEEPPSTVRIILLATRPPLLTITSRCVVHRMGYLTPDDVERALVGQGMDPAEAARRAELDTGTPRAAAASDEQDNAKGPVLSAVRAAMTGDRDLLRNATREVGPEHWDALKTWAREVRTGRHRRFSKAETFGAQRDDPAVLAILRARMGRSPRIAVRAALGPSCERNAG